MSNKKAIPFESVPRPPIGFPPYKITFHHSFCKRKNGIFVFPRRNHRLTERLYADIDFEDSAAVYGFIYLITDKHLRALDAFEGYPKVYRRMWLEVELEGENYMALTYEMTAETKCARNGKPYPEEYRQICSAGARFHHVKNQFTKRKHKA